MKSTMLLAFALTCACAMPATAQTTFRDKLTRMPKSDLYAARIGYGVGGGVCLGSGLALLGAVGITAAMNDKFGQEFGVYGNAWNDRTIVGMAISGGSGVVLIVVSIGLLSRATMASREFERRGYGAVRVVVVPGGVGVAGRW